MRLEHAFPQALGAVARPPKAAWPAMIGAATSKEPSSSATGRGRRRTCGRDRAARLTAAKQERGAKTGR